MADARIRTRLCPHCANSIAVDALTCPYCKADLLTASTDPEWPRHDDDLPPRGANAEKDKLTVKSKAILIMGLCVFALGVYLVGNKVEHGDVAPQIASQEQAIRDRDEKIKQLESELAEERQSAQRDSQGSSRQVEQLKAKLLESQKELAAAKQKLTAASREIARLSASQVAASAPRPARPADPVPARAARTRAAQARLYETLRSSPVYEQPDHSSRVVAQIGRGTQITVVGSGDGWLEVRSKHGQPPGYIRADDAMFLSRAN